MFNNTTQRLVNLPRPLPKPEADLPRGECRFIQRERDAQTGSRQRCVCQGFSLDKQQVVGTGCECGHPAWVHVQQPMAAVTYEEHVALAEEMRRFKQEQDTRLKSLQLELVKTQHELLAQRALYSERERLFKAIEARMYQNMKAMKMQLDDKMDGMIDQQHAFQKKLIDVEDATMEHEIHFEKLGIPDKEPPSTLSAVAAAPAVVSAARSATDGHVMHIAAANTRVRSPEKRPQPWGARVIMVPHRMQRFAFESSSKASKRCQSRNLHQDVSFPNTDNATFIVHIDNAFNHALKGRPWIPLVATRPPDDPLARLALRPLPADLASPALWDLAFLRRHCFALDEALGAEVLYIALRDADLSWDEMRALPPSLNTTAADEESAWAHDVELDAPMLLPPLHQHQHPRLEADLMDAAAPPPYVHAFAQQQRQSNSGGGGGGNSGAAKLAMADRLHTPLGVLAASAAILAPLAKVPPPTPSPVAPLTPALTVSSLRRSSSSVVGAGAGPVPPPISISPAPAPAVAPLSLAFTTVTSSSSCSDGDCDGNGDNTNDNDSEHSHRDKIRKRSPPSLPPPTEHQQAARRPSPPLRKRTEPVYCSGRSKRKMPVRGKQREALQMPRFLLPGLLGGGAGGR